MELFDGNYQAKILDEQIAKYLEVNPEARNRKLTIIQIGDDITSDKYARLKVSLCEKFNIPVEYKNVSASLSYSEASKVVLSSVDSSSGVIIQLPLPRGNLHDLLNLLPVEKDPDFLSHKSRTISKKGLPPVVRAVELFLKQVKSKPKTCTLIGYGFLVGQPLEKYLKSGGIDVEVLDEDDDVFDTTLESDLVILAAGEPKLMSGVNLKDGAHVIDFGSTIVDEKIVGDLDLKSDIEHLGLVSPSPGGVGPIVVRFLIMNHLGI